MLVSLRLRTTVLLCLLFATSLNSQWVKVSNPQGLPAAGWQALAIDACDSNTVGFVASYWQGTDKISKFVRTTDGGNTWELFTTPEGDAVDISMKDKNHIWYVTMNGKIYCTADGGTTWLKQFEDSTKTEFMNFIKMFDLSRGFAMGDNLTIQKDSAGHDIQPGPATFLKTTDGGKTWNALNVSAVGGVSGDLWRRLDFPSMNIGYFFETGLNPQYLYKTQMGGAKWAKLSTFTHPYAQVVKFYDDFLGLIVNKDSVYRTKDGGYTWERFNLLPSGMGGTSGYGNDIEFFPGDASKLWVISTGGAFFSKDTGRTFKWYSSLSGTGGTPRDIVFSDKNHGWLYMDMGILYKTENLIKITDVNESRTVVGEYKLLQNYPNPFNPSTTINYSVAEGGFVKVKVYDMLGCELATLVNEYRPAGSNSVRFNASSLPSGVYFYMIEAGDFRDVKKLMVVK